MTNYTHRLSILTEKRTYSVGDNALTWSDDDGTSDSLNYSNITRVTGKFDPSRVQLNKYSLKIHSRNRAPLEITNTSFEGFNDFSDHSDQFRAFSVTLHKKIRSKNPDAKFAKGSTPLGYLLSVFTTIFIGILILLAAIFFITSGMYGIVIVKFLLIIFYFPSLLRYLKNNKPANYDPYNIPQEILP